MRIGYSFWGFLGRGVTDTPDGGRSHRLGFVEALAARGHGLVFLQENRDASGTGEVFDFRWDVGTPELDLLFFEWRWPIPGRNCGVDRASPSYTPDLDRQQQLLTYYVEERATPTVVWDKDLHLPLDDPIRRFRHVRILEAARFPRPGARTLLFPVPPHAAGDLAAARTQRADELDLVYIGNQYGRDEAFDTYFAAVAGSMRHAVFGKWTNTRGWPHVAFHGRIPFEEVRPRYLTSSVTPAIVPPRYAAVGQMTQRLVEAATAGCVPCVPAEVRGAEDLVPGFLVAHGPADVRRVVEHLHRHPADRWHMIDACWARLDMYSLPRQVAALETTIAELTREPF